MILGSSLKYTQVTGFWYKIVILITPNSNIMNRKRGNLSIDVHDSHEESFMMDDGVFIKGNVAINARGVAMRDNPKTFTLAYDELQIGDIIGRGSSSIVLHGSHMPTRTPLALKVINLFDKSKREQLIREIKSLYNAECDSLIRFYGAFYREGSITIALEYMDGGSLANVLSQLGPIPEHVLAPIAYQILWGLAYMKHEKRVHRDVKPSNLLINSRGEVKVTDFGVSAELQSSIAMCGTFVGTFKYMSPERIRNRPYSYASDIWSFGLVISECATGIYPFQEHSNCIEMAQTILDTDLQPFSSSQFSPSLVDFVSQCLKRDPSLRLPAEVLLGAPWLQQHGVTSYEIAVDRVRRWIESLSGQGATGAVSGPSTRGGGAECKMEIHMDMDREFKGHK
jgi:mitogen-activated protein kinase kinase 3